MRTASATKAASSFGRAMWVWDAKTIITPKRQAELFAFCKRKNISTIYQSVGSVFLETEAAAKQPQVSTAALGVFLRAAHVKGLRVEVVDGDPTFALTSQHATTLARLQRALDYNKSAPPQERIDGWQWDTEPYILTDFDKSPERKREILTQFLDSAAQMRDAVQKSTQGSSSFALGYAIPMWWDNQELALPWGGTTKPAAFHLMDVLNEVPGGYIAIMAYRDSAEGANGSIAHTTLEADYATKSAPNVHVWVGQETLDVKGDPPTITFWQEGEGEMEKAINQIRQHYQKVPAIAGVAIHHWDSYTALSERAAVKPVVAKFKVIAPAAGPSARETLVRGTAPPAQKVIVEVRPKGDIWYEQGIVSVPPSGEWSVTTRLGNEQTPVGTEFTIRVTQKDKENKTVTQQEVEVTRQ